MEAYLLTWNPKRWTWENLESEIVKVQRTGSVKSRWSCGVRTHLPVGSRFFLIRLGDPKTNGIIGAGTTLTEPFHADHFDESKRAEGVEALYVDVKFTSLGTVPVVDWATLNSTPLDGCNWRTQASGIRIPDDIADSLEALYFGSAHEFRFAEELNEYQSTTFTEGAKRTVVVDAYERDPKARAQCLAHHGYRCAVCGLSMHERYGDVAKDFIHVHHLHPLGSIGEAHQVDPATDLIPVCPNCHAVIHLGGQCRSIDSVKRMLNL